MIDLKEQYPLLLPGTPFALARGRATPEPGESVTRVEMTMNGIRIARAIIGLAMGTVVMATMPACALPLGYGTLVGTFDASGPFPPGYHNPQDEGGNAGEIGGYILGVPGYTNAFDIGDFEFGGSDVTPLGAGIGFSFSFADTKNGSWTYLGVPGQTTVDLYLAVKYGNAFSIFYYNEVLLGDTGLFTSDFVVYGNGITGCTNLADINFSATCMDVNKSGKAQDISHVVAYWPPGTTTSSGGGGSGGDPTPIPEPAALALLGAGLFGLGLARRRNRI